MSADAASFGPLMAAVQARARESGVFGEILVREGRLDCRAKGSSAPAWYRLGVEDGRLWVSLVMADRWLSESIETDLLHTGDKLEELLEEELVELGHRGAPVPFEHFRSEEKLFTFRSPVDAIECGRDDAGASGQVAGAAMLLLAYEACFRNLGDMCPGEGS